MHPMSCGRDEQIAHGGECRRIDLHKYAGGKIVEAVSGVNLAAVRRDPDAGAGHQIAVDAVPRVFSAAEWARLAAGLEQRLVGAGERDAVDHDQLARLPRHVDALPQRQRAEQARALVLGELLDQQARRVVALAQDRVLELVPQRLGGGLGRPRPVVAPSGDLPRVSVVVASADPAADIAARVRNLFESTPVFPHGPVETLEELLKKKVPLDAISSLTAESAVIAPIHAMIWPEKLAKASGPMIDPLCLGSSVIRSMPGCKYFVTCVTDA